MFHCWECFSLSGCQAHCPLCIRIFARLYLAPTPEYGGREEEMDSSEHTQRAHWRCVSGSGVIQRGLFYGKPRVETMRGNKEATNCLWHCSVAIWSEEKYIWTEPVLERRGVRCCRSDAKSVADLFSNSPFSPSFAIFSLSHISLPVSISLLSWFCRRRRIRKQGCFAPQI